MFQRIVFTPDLYKYSKSGEKKVNMISCPTDFANAFGEESPSLIFILTLVELDYNFYIEFSMENSYQGSKGIKTSPRTLVLS